MDCPKACGICCRRMMFRYKNDEQTKEWAKARGMKINQISKTHVEMILHHPCPQLLPNGKCKIHDKKPYACQVYPQMEGLEEWGLDSNKSLPKGCFYREEGK